MKTSDQISGGCLCGAVQFTALDAPVLAEGCCCRDCARATGAPFTVWVGFAPDAVKFTGEAQTYYASSETVRRGHCAKCGTSLSYARSGPAAEVDPLLHISGAAFDDPEEFAPTEVVYYSERPAWFELVKSMPLFSGQAPSYRNRGSKG